MMTHSTDSLYCKGSLPVLLTLVTVALFIPSALAAEHTVAPAGAEFSSIQDAIAHAIPGDTITVGSGTYDETVHIGVPLMVLGTDTGGGLPVIVSVGEGNAVEITANGVTFSGFVVRNAKMLSGIHITSDNNQITGNTVTNCSQGILLETANSNNISGNSIVKNVRSGMALERSGKNAIWNNTFTRNSIGITLDEYSNANRIVLNNFENTVNVVSRSITSRYDTELPQKYTYLGIPQNTRMGNYWNDYLGNDTIHDGIGDYPYVIKLGVNPNAVLQVNQDSTDSFPLMDPIGYYRMDPGNSPTAVAVVTVPVTAVTTLSSIDNMTGVIDVIMPGENSPDIFTGTVALAIFATICLLTVVALILYHRGKSQRARIRVAVPVDAAPATANQPETGSPGIQKPVSAEEVEVQESAQSSATIVPDATTGNDTGGRATALAHPYFPHELDGRYADVQLIGRGGIAYVYSATRISDRKKVAVKIPISFDEMTGKSFLNEIKVWEMLRHKNIVKISTVNILPLPYVEMEFVPGSLETVKKPLPVQKAAEIIRGVADALQYAHERGIIHRDIKPHNILVTADLSPKITDWGMCKVIALEPGRSSIAGFSLSYAAPEQVSPADFGRTTDARTDIYQLGVVFYELVTGSIPFGGESIVSVGNAILREKPIPPSKYNADAAPVDPIIMRCLEKDPALRYQNAGDVANALAAYLNENM